MKKRFAVLVLLGLILAGCAPQGKTELGSYNAGSQAKALQLAHDEHKNRFTKIECIDRGLDIYRCYGTPIQPDR